MIDLPLSSSADALSSTSPLPDLVYAAEVKLAQVLAEVSASLREVRARLPPEIARADGPRLRPHSLPGYWQVWSGQVCVAILAPEDVEILRANLAAPAPDEGKKK